MTLLSSRIVLRPRTLGETFDLVLPFLVAHRWFWLRLSLATLLPVFGAALGLLLLLLPEDVKDIDAGLMLFSVWPLAFLYVQDIFVVASSALLFEENVTVRAVLKRYRRHAFTGLPAAIALFLWNVLTLCVFIGIYYAPTRAFVREAALLEGASVGAAFRRSTALTHDLTSHVVGYWITAWAVPLVVSVFVWLVGINVAEHMFMFTVTDSLHFWLALAGVAIAAVPAAVARFLMYVDLRTRKEGWDLQLRLLAIKQADDELQKKRNAVAA